MECEKSMEENENKATASVIPPSSEDSLLNTSLNVGDIKKEKEEEEEEEELLGSMTTYNNEGSDSKIQQVRSSARVYKKMKLDRELDATVVVTPEKEEKKEEPKSEIKKAFRILWTSYDKDLFFEALNEYGKEFESIHSYICNKSKKKGLDDHLMKSKDQIRHFYYRMWHKISKYYQFSEGIKKVAQELYALINYGEMRRKLRFVNEKYYCKLQELIYRGNVAIRNKGKTIRIKTPMCRALRRLNQLDDRYDELKLPSRITLDLKPKDMYSFLKVQGLAHNPRLRTILPLQKRLSSVIYAVSKRWKTLEAHLYDQAVLSKNIATNDCVPPAEEIKENKLLLSNSIRFMPPDDTEIELPSINLCEYYTRQSLCLRAYENKLGIKHSEEQLLAMNESKLKILSKNLTKKNKESKESISEMDDGEIVNKAVNEALSSLLQLQSVCEGIKTEKDEFNKEIASEIDSNEEANQRQKTEKISEIRKGWTLSECTTVSIGDLYLMFGNNSKLVLEYKWEDYNPQYQSNNSTIENSESEKNVNDDWNCNASTSLKKLISLAKMHYENDKNISNKCTCGHICGTKPAQTRTKSTPRSKNTVEESSGNLPDEISADESMEIDQKPFSAEITADNISHSSIFRTPFVPSNNLITQLDSLQKLKPRFVNRKNRRPRMKQVVVERQLSLLPNNVESGHIVTMNIVPQESKQPEVSIEESKMIDEPQLFSTDICSAILKQESIITREDQEVCDINSFKLVSADNAHDGSFGVGDTPSSSPSRILKENENQWINAEVGDFSLSSFLGHLDSPSKSLMSMSAGEETLQEGEDVCS